MDPLGCWAQAPDSFKVRFIWWKHYETLVKWPNRLMGHSRTIEAFWKVESSNLPIPLILRLSKAALLPIPPNMTGQIAIHPFPNSFLHPGLPYQKKRGVGSWYLWLTRGRDWSEVPCWHLSKVMFTGQQKDSQSTIHHNWSAESFDYQVNNSIVSWRLKNRLSAHPASNQGLEGLFQHALTPRLHKCSLFLYLANQNPVCSWQS